MLNSDFLLSLGFGISLFFNVIFGMCVIGYFFKTPEKKQEKKVKKPELVLYMIGLLVGFLGGLIGNITITSMFELVKLYQPTSPGYWGTIFIISMAGTVMIIIKMHSILKDAMAE